MLEDRDDGVLGTSSAEENPKAHHQGWNLALDRALAKASEVFDNGTHEVEIEFIAEMEVTNPGDIKTYGVIIKPHG